MKKTLLTAALLTTLTALHAQRTVVSAERVDLDLSGDRGTDTLYLTSFGAGDLAFYTSASGWVVGTNNYGDVQKAQEFQMSGPATIDEVLYFFAKNVGTGGASSVISARIYEMNGTGTTTAGADQPAPGTVMAETEVSIDDIDTTGMMGIMLGPVWVNGHFAAGVDFSGLAANDSIGLLSTLDENSEVIDRSWEQWSDGDWYTLAQAWPLDIDLVILPVFSESSVGINDGTWVNDMRMSFIGGNPANENVLVTFENQQNADMALTVIDASGRTVLDHDLGNRAAGQHNYDLNTSSWNAGMYYVTLRANGQPMTLKLVVE